MSVIFKQQLTGKVLVEKDAKALRDMGMTLKQAVLLKAIVERIINGSKSNNSQLAESSVNQLPKSTSLQFEMFECERRYGKLEDYGRLGRGAFGTVFRVSTVKRKEERALKSSFQAARKKSTSHSRRHSN